MLNMKSWGSWSVSSEQSESWHLHNLSPLQRRLTHAITVWSFPFPNLHRKELPDNCWLFHTHGLWNFHEPYQHGRHSENSVKYWPINFAFSRTSTNGNVEFTATPTDIQTTSNGCRAPPQHCWRSHPFFLRTYNRSSYTYISTFNVIKISSMSCRWQLSIIL